MKAIIFTQVYENYAFNEDGTIGTGADAYFKPKGGNEYVVRNVSEEDEPFEIIEQVAGKIVQSNDYFQESIIDCQIVDDDYLTEYEQNQLAFDGRIVYSPQEIDLEAV